MTPSHSEPTLSSLQFRWPWRNYQQRVLAAVDYHLADDRLHIVAAPGSGKTTLGLEVIRRLGRPALVLSPTRTIRNQWINRLKDFLDEEAAWPLSWTSTNLNLPGLLTSVTYQALHTRYRDLEIVEDTQQVEEDAELDDAPNGEELERMVGQLKEARIGTLVLDEAHHLRAEWWKALSVVLEALPGLKLVSLTATPPYDVSGHEWNKYHTLCGSIDEEISVPELVKSGTLCPHQDYIWSVVPLRSERQRAYEYDHAVNRITHELYGDEQFAVAVKEHPWFGTEPDLEMVLDEPEVAMALLIFAHAKKLAPPQGLMKILDLQVEDLPPLSRRWWQVLVKAYLFDRHWHLDETGEVHRKELAGLLRSEQLLWRRELRLETSRLVKGMLTLSSAKIGACVEIHREERKQRGEGLRQVILTDFIRDESLDMDEQPESPPLGAWPIFHALVRELGEGSVGDVALLTGRVVVLHQSRLALLTELLGGQEVNPSPLNSMPGYVRLSAGGKMVAAFTRLLQLGGLRVLVGTRALLGEGWDAPSINSLILASFVGSYMLTNQMRGRAIRVDKANPQKVASIWHIVAMATENDAGLLDYYELERRFGTFVGLSEQAEVIENGLKRIALPYQYGNTLKVSDFNAAQSNAQMLRRLSRIETVPERWHTAIDQGHEGRVVPTIKTETPPHRAPLHFKNTMKYLLLELLYTFLGVFSYIMNGTGEQQIEDMQELLVIVAVAALLAALYTLPRLIRAVVILIRHLPVDGTIRQMGLALRDALCASGLIENAPQRLPVLTTKYGDGSVCISLGNGSFYEQSLFADAMGEILGPIENPRYLLTRQKKRWRWQRRDYHAVPLVLGVKKKYAEILYQAWKSRVGETELIYARAKEGRKLLLQARARAFSTALADKLERLDRWQ